jgi:hypothetical protein
MYCAEGVEARELSVWKEALAGGDASTRSRRGSSTPAAP